MRTASDMTSTRPATGLEHGGGGYLVETLELAQGTDPFHLLTPSPTGFQAWWHHAGRTLVGTGIAVELRSQAAERFSDIADQLSGIPSPALAFTGGAFRSHASATARTAGFPDAAAWVPELLASSDGRATTLIAVAAPGTASPEQLRKRLEEAAAVLQASAQPADAVLQALPQPSAASPDRGTAGAGRTSEPALTPGAPAFDDAVARATDRIARGELAKVVLARRAQAQRDTPLQAPSLASALRGRFPSAYAFGIQHGDELFAGASPELLVQVDGLAVTSTPAAGTASAGEPLDALRTNKNLREQGIVVDAVASALTPFCDQLDISEPHALDAGPVRHLVTDVQGRLTTRTHVLDLVQALHPTPAVCGTPTEAASATISEVEGFDRGWYAGPIGVVSPTGDGTLAIALRALRAQGTRLERFAGAGIIAGSEAAAERREIDHKLSAMGDLLDALDALDR